MLNIILALLVGATEGPSMHDFALIFRPTKPIAQADLQRRNEAARAWALALRKDGVLLYAAPLEDDGIVVSASGTASTPNQPPVASVLIITARDSEAVLALVKTHPGLAFGTSVEIRPLKQTAPAGQ